MGKYPTYEETVNKYELDKFNRAVEMYRKTAETLINVLQQTSDNIDHYLQDYINNKDNIDPNEYKGFEQFMDEQYKILSEKIGDYDVITKKLETEYKGNVNDSFAELSEKEQRKNESKHKSCKALEDEIIQLTKKIKFEFIKVHKAYYNQGKTLTKHLEKTQVAHLKNVLKIPSIEEYNIVKENNTIKIIPPKDCCIKDRDGHFTGFRVSQHGVELRTEHNEYSYMAGSINDKYLCQNILPPEMMAICRIITDQIIDDPKHEIKPIDFHMARHEHNIGASPEQIIIMNKFIDQVNRALQPQEQSLVQDFKASIMQAKANLESQHPNNPNIDKNKQTLIDD